MARPRKYPLELRERAVRLVFESGRPIAHVAQDLGVHNQNFPVFDHHYYWGHSGRLRYRCDVLTSVEASCQPTIMRL